MPGYDFVGRIDALGARVTSWSLGERVADLCTIGANASHIVRSANDLTRVPDSLNAAEACSFILSGVTAWQLFFRHARVARGERILVQGGNGGVGWFAVQFALSAGLHVWATARAEHHAALRALGATPLDYRDPNYPAQLRTDAAGGVDWVVDGQGADGFRSSLACLRPGGKLVFIGTSEAVNQGRSMLTTGAKLLARNLIPWGPRIGLYSVTGMRKRHPEWFKEDLAKLFDTLERKTVVVRIDRRIGFDEVPAAHGALHHLLPTALSAIQGRFGYAPQLWVGIARLRFRAVGAHLEPPDALAFAPKGFHDSSTTVLAAIVDYTFGPRFDQWWLGTGVEVWWRRIGHGAAPEEAASWTSPSKPRCR